MLKWCGWRDLNPHETNIPLEPKSSDALGVIGRSGVSLNKTCVSGSADLSSGVTGDIVTTAKCHKPLRLSPPPLQARFNPIPAHAAPASDSSGVAASGRILPKLPDDGRRAERAA